MADIYGNVSAAGGFDQTEVDFVTQLINSGQVSVADVAKQFGLPESIISAAYEANRPAVEAAAIERFTQNQAAPESLSPAATATISSPFLPDATYEIPGFSMPDYRYTDSSGSGVSLSGGTGGNLTNYVTAVEPARSGPEGYTGPEMVVTPGDGLGPGEYSLGNATLDRGIGGGGSFVDGNSSTFVQDLADQDAREAAEDVDYLDYLARLAAQEANKPLGGTQGAYDAILEASAITDTTSEFLEDIAAANQAVIDAQTAPVDTNLSYQEGIDKKLEDISNAKTEKDFVTATALNSGLVDQGDIDEAFGPTFAETALEGLSNVLGAGTRGIYNVASNIPVVGGYLGDSIEGVADFFKNTEGTLTVNPITGAVQGTWGEIPPWMEKQTVTQIGNIPGSQTTAGVTTGTILDDFISIGRGEQDIGDVLEDRTGQVASTIGIDPAIIAAAAALGKTVEEYLADQKTKQTTKQTTLAPETEDETEAGVKPVAVDLGGGRDDDEEPATQEAATITPSTSDGTSLPEGVAGPLFVPDTEVTLDEVLDIIESTPTERERLPGFQLPEEEPVVEPPVLVEEPVVEPPVLVEEPVVEPPVLVEEPVVEPPVLVEEPVFPELLEAMQGYRGVQTKPGELVDIDYLYDISDPSIFAPKMQGEDEEDALAYLYSNLGDSGIVQDYDIEELIRFLESQRG